MPIGVGAASAEGTCTLKGPHLASYLDLLPAALPFVSPPSWDYNRVERP